MMLMRGVTVGLCGSQGGYRREFVWHREVVRLYGLSVSKVAMMFQVGGPRGTSGDPWGIVVGVFLKGDRGYK